MEKLDFLINYLLNENTNITVDKFPERECDKKRLYRSLCNIRNANPISNNYIEIENKFLQEELKNKKLTNENEIKRLEKIEKICLWKGDITTLKIDAIVNAANSYGLGCFIPCHKCIDNQIHTFAGIQLRLECKRKMDKIGILKTGQAFITKGYNLPCRYVIHTVGPNIHSVLRNENICDLKMCYFNSLELAKKYKLRTVAFPCISTGEFAFPKEIAVQCAFSAVEEYLKKNSTFFDKIIFNLYNKEDVEIYERYVKENY